MSDDWRIKWKKSMKDWDNMTKINGTGFARL